MKRTYIIMIITLILTAINNISYADVLKGENAYNVFRINDYKNIKYKIDESNTNKYRNHTDAWKMQLIVLRMILLAKLDL